METTELKKLVEKVLAENKVLENREKELAERYEELQAQKEELNAAIEAFMEKSDSLAEANIELKQRNFELEQILYRTSHDLRTPIASMEGLIQILDQKHNSADDAIVQKHLMAMVHQMKEVLDSLGNLAEASFERLTIEKIEVEDLFRQAIGSLANLSNYENVDFRLAVPPGATLYTDVKLMRKVLRAVISNAVIFRDPDKNGVVCLSIIQNENTTAIEVTDDGEGIIPEARERIFEMFYRGSKRSTGLGLGLYIVKRILHRMNGSIEMSSEPGRTTFSIVLPVHLPL
jgi:signal transduction histidine kinase